MLDGVPRPLTQAPPNPSNSLFSRIADSPSHDAPVTNGMSHNGTSFASYGSSSFCMRPTLNTLCIERRFHNVSDPL